jgi:hypothetical protein
MKNIVLIENDKLKWLGLEREGKLILIQLKFDNTQADSKPVRLEVSSTVIHPPLVFPGWTYRKKFFKMGWLGNWVKFKMAKHRQMRKLTMDKDDSTIKRAVCGKCCNSF